MKFDRLTYYLITCFLLITIQVSCGPEKTVEDESRDMSPGATDPAEVTVAPAVIKPLNYLINTSGTIKAARTIEMKSAVSGIIRSVNVINGQYVKRGSVVATLENTRQQIALQKAEVNLEEFQLDYNNELLNYTGGTTTTSISQDIKDNIRLSSGLKKAELDLREARLNLSNTYLRAPFSGQLANLSITRGQSIGPGEKIADLHSSQELLLEFRILETDFPLIRTGLHCVAYPVGNKNAVLEAEIKEINPEVDEKTGLVIITAKILGESKLLIPGMNMAVTVEIPGKPVIVIPKNAVLTRSGKKVVFTLEDNLAKWNYVEIGKENGLETEILDGLEENKLVITTNNLQLAHDAPVKVLEKP